MEQKLLKINNPALARKMLWFKVASLVLVFIAWGVNLAVLTFNLLMPGMIWPVAVTIFCIVWLVDYLIQHTIMVSIARQLLLEATIDACKSVNNYVNDLIDDVSPEE